MVVDGGNVLLHDKLAFSRTVKKASCSLHLSFRKCSFIVNSFAAAAYCLPLQHVSATAQILCCLLVVHLLLIMFMYVSYAS